MTVRIDALEACNDDDLASVEIGEHAGAVDFADARFRERAVCLDRHLPAGIAHGFEPFGLQRDGQQADADLLAGRRDHVEFARVRMRR